MSAGPLRQPPIFKLFGQLASPFGRRWGVNARRGAPPQHQPAPLRARAPSAMPGLEEELRGMKLGALSKRARQAGVTAEQLEDAQDEDEPKFGYSWQPKVAHYYTTPLWR